MDKTSRIKKTWKVIITLISALIVYQLFVWYSHTMTTFEYATIIHADTDSITLQNEGGRKTTVSTSLDLSKIIEIENKYWVTYERKRWKNPQLLAIEP